MTGGSTPVTIDSATFAQPRASIIDPGNMIWVFSRADKTFPILCDLDDLARVAGWDVVNDLHYLQWHMFPGFDLYSCADPAQLLTTADGDLLLVDDLDDL